ncbi:MAG: ArgE/DapE family deacylase, partial [bacterium]
GECVRVLGEKLSQLGIDWTEVQVPEDRLRELAPKGAGLPRPSIVGHWGEGEKEVHFHGHYDVVPPVSVEQLRPYVSDGKLHGRGAADMKGGLAVILFALQTLKECDVKLDGTLSFSFTPDEETGGAAGLKYLLDAGYINRTVIGVIDPEPSGGEIINGSRGALSFDLIVKGRASHVMVQHLGVNAFEKMIEVADAFMKLKREIEQRRTHYRITPPEADRSVLLIGGVCGGGTNFNIVPESSFFSVDRRFNPEESLADVRREIDELIASLRQRGIEVETKVFQEGEASVTSEDEPICLALSKVVEGVKGQPVGVGICPGLLETRFLVQEGIPAVIYGPGRLELAHGPEEYVGVEDLLNCTEVYAATAIELLGA